MSQSHRSLLFASGYATADQSGIRAFTVDTDSGALAPCGAYAGVVNPSFIVPHPNGRWLYTVSETAEPTDGVSGSVWALRVQRDAAGNVTFSPINRQPSAGDLPCHLAPDATGHWLIVSNYGSGSAVVLPVLADGALGPLTTLVQHGGHGPNPARQEGPHAHSTILSPDNRFAVVADLGIDRLMMYRFDAGSGSLAAHGDCAARPGAGPRHMVFHPNGRVLYVSNELDSTLTAYTYDEAEGSLREMRTLETISSGGPDNLAAHVAFSAASQRVIVSNRGHNTLAVFEAAPDGRLALAGSLDCGGNWPRHFALAPGGRFVLVANQFSGDVSVLPLGGASFAPVARAPLPQASCVQFVPLDG